MQNGSAGESEPESEDRDYDDDNLDNLLSHPAALTEKYKSEVSHS
jgi:hypothetical protein